MNVYIIAWVVLCLLFSVFYEWAVPGWAGFDLSKLLLISALSGALWHKLSYKELMFKSVAFLVFIDSVWNIGQWFAEGSLQGPLEFINAAIFAPWFAWALHRSYRARSVPIEEGNAYWVAHNPDNTTGFITSLFGGPVAGYSLYMEGRLYGYHRGGFKGRALSASRLNVIAIDAHIKSPAEVRKYLNGIDGRRWSPLNNCLTLRLKVWYINVR